jgi:HAD superfamily hydrolase (TIGR01509 family)
VAPGLSLLLDIELITIDLDDTLWPCAPPLVAAEQAMHAWLQRVAPALAARHGPEELRAHRAWLREAQPQLAHDVTGLRLASLRQLLEGHGYSRLLAEQGIALFLELRNQVAPYPDAAPVLAALARRYRLVALTNGNAEVARTPLGSFFQGSFQAAEVGAAKPNPALFRAALAWSDVVPQAALHPGDDPLLDVAAARAVGMHAWWVNRSGGAWPAGLAMPERELRDLYGLRDPLLT